MAERNQDVVGSHGGCQVPNNHSKYRTSLVCTGVGTLIDFQRYHSGPGVQPPDSAASAAIYLRVRTGQKGLYRRVGILRPYTRQYHLPNRGLQPWRRRRGDQVSGLDHVNSLRQRRVEPHPELVRVEARGERDLQILSLACRSSRRAAVIGDLWMR